ncbi:MAG: hypothetical protein IMZ50_12140 [Candidatus Atribacteria bacterium]|nr:hypothetical protein [Planctomycetota bacterium]MBE3119486.1 hypothetical protein [Candidatus Atribacteria bacterium]
MVRTVLRVVCAVSALVMVTAIAFIAIIEVYSVATAFLFSKPFLEETRERLLIGAISLTLGFAAAALLWVRTGHFSLRQLVAAAAAGSVLVAALVAFAVYAVWSFNSVFEIYDTDRGYVAEGVIDTRLYCLTGLYLPRGAHGMHVLSVGGLSPVLLLEFTAAPNEARAFLERMRVINAAFPMEQHVGILPTDVTQYGRDKNWWRPRNDLPWFYDKVGGDVRFIQVDYDTGRVYLLVASR